MVDTLQPRCKLHGKEGNMCALAVLVLTTPHSERNKHAPMHAKLVRMLVEQILDSGYAEHAHVYAVTTSMHERCTKLPLLYRTRRTLPASICSLPG